MQPTGRARLNRWLPIFIVFASLSTAGPASALPGDLDPTFGVAGVTVVPEVNAAARAIAVQPDGFIVVGGFCGVSSSTCVLRLDPNGTLDPTWGTAGIAKFVGQLFFFGGLHALAVAPDGKVLIGAESSSPGLFSLVRLDASGALDPSFGSGGIAKLFPNDTPSFGLSGVQAISIRPNGKIVVAGARTVGLHREFVVGQFLDDGSIDPLFANGGVSQTKLSTGSASADSLALTATGQVIAGGTSGNSRAAMQLHRLDGFLAPSFGLKGKLLLPIAATASFSEAAFIEQQSDGRIVVGFKSFHPGSPGSDWMFDLQRFEIDGTVDVGFAEPHVGDGFDAAMTIQGNDAIVTNTGKTLRRYHSDGSLDLTFGVAGASTLVVAGESFEGIALQSDGKILVFSDSSSGFIVARADGGAYCGNGTIDAGEQCDDGNASAGDCCDTACQLEANGATCSDGDLCTFGDVCSAGSCVGGSAQPSSCGNHYSCYRAKTNIGSNKFSKQIAVPLDDAFEVSSVDLTKEMAVCLPADKADEGIIDPNTSLLSYRLRRSSGAAKHVARKGIVVRDQFGELTLDTKRPDRLLVPAQELGAPPPGTADHHQCYIVRTSKGAPKFMKELQVPVVDELEDRIWEVRKPSRLCLAADKNGEGISNPGAHLMCYRTKSRSGEPKPAPAALADRTDQFGTLGLLTRRSEELCVPATVTIP